MTPNVATIGELMRSLMLVPFFVIGCIRHTVHLDRLAELEANATKIDQPQIELGFVDNALLVGSPPGERVLLGVWKINSSELVTVTNRAILLEAWTYCEDGTPQRLNVASYIKECYLFSEGVEQTLLVTPAAPRDDGVISFVDGFTLPIGLSKHALYCDTGTNLPANGKYIAFVNDIKQMNTSPLVARNAAGIVAQVKMDTHNMQGPKNPRMSVVIDPNSFTTFKIKEQ